MTKIFLEDIKLFFTIYRTKKEEFLIEPVKEINLFSLVFIYLVKETSRFTGIKLQFCFFLNRLFLVD